MIRFTAPAGAVQKIYLFAANPLNGITKCLDKRSCGYKRRSEAMRKMTELLEPMIKRILSAGVETSYILMDSWFAFPSVIKALSEHRLVICMLKDLSAFWYRHAFIRSGSANCIEGCASGQAGLQSWQT